MQTVISVPLPQNPYPVVLEAGGLGNIGAYLSQPERISAHLGSHQSGHKLGKENLGKKVLVVSNPTIWKHYGPTVVTSLAQAGFDVAHCILPAGERYKTLRSLEKIFDSALAHRLERSSTMIALGGGVVGDMTGFAAASWLRGIAVVQVPTTLLAMVDASIGGKTGVNHPQGKNLIGAFHQPRLVLIDPETLHTLPTREFRAGMAEVIKYGVIWDAELFEQLEAADQIDRHRAFTPALLLDMLRRSCQAKVDVVSQDEKESGLRAILNYGHTIGHAIESLTQYRTFNHGEGVGLGMIAVGDIAARLKLWPKDTAERQYQLIQKAGLPTQLPASFETAAVLEVLTTDKKVRAGQVRFILPTGLGQVKITDQVPTSEILGALRQMQAVAAD
ncbi:MAG: 3-dehydroquinate synthase [Thermosynechococcaceae cyanobacterium MS004]|nr:3-dehydroquinate synthase [Thermosynechococcaceae cyanobacterium MS004]